MSFLMLFANFASLREISPKILRQSRKRRGLGGGSSMNSTFSTLLESCYIRGAEISIPRQSLPDLSGDSDGILSNKS